MIVIQVISAICAIANAYWAGRSNRRYIHIVIPTAVTLVALVLLTAVTNNAARYFAMCLMLAGSSSHPIVLTWLANTCMQPAAKRASAVSIACAIATINHLYNPFLFRGQ